MRIYAPSGEFVDDSRPGAPRRMHASACSQGIQESSTLAVRLFFRNQFFFQALGRIIGRHAGRESLPAAVWLC